MVVPKNSSGLTNTNVYLTIYICSIKCGPGLSGVQNRKLMGEDLCDVMV